MICSELIPKIVSLKNIHRLLQSPICFWPVILLMCPGRKISSNGNTPETVLLPPSIWFHPPLPPSLHLSLTNGPDGLINITLKHPATASAALHNNQLLARVRACACVRARMHVFACGSYTLCVCVQIDSCDASVFALQESCVL